MTKKDEGASGPAPDIKVRAVVGSDGEPAVEITVPGGATFVVSVFVARGLALQLILQSEQAESEAFLRAYFAKARDQVMAQKILDSMIPGMLADRQKRLAAFASAMLNLGGAV